MAVTFAKAGFILWSFLPPPSPPIPHLLWVTIFKYLNLLLLHSPWFGRKLLRRGNTWTLTFPHLYRAFLLEYLILTQETSWICLQHTDPVPLSFSAPQGNGDIKENRSPTLSTESVLGLCNLFMMADFGSQHKEPGMGFQFSSNCLSTSPNKNACHSNFATPNSYSDLAPAARMRGTFSPLPTPPRSSQQISPDKFPHLNHWSTLWWWIGKYKVQMSFLLPDPLIVDQGQALNQT